ncbi:MAG: ABC transporter ATP-binding protein [Thermodesulfobacteriota bacterium]|nr:ABC transporter ATP-binding protein [Thermodesulfobacteriota bacterium]
MLIRLNNVKKIYRLGEIEIMALDGISFQIAEGEFVAIMGSSGSGKTTILNILGCLARPTSGEYFLDGQNVEELNDKDLARLRNKKIGFVFQNFNLLSRFTALENVELPLIYAGVGKKERAALSVKVLEEVGLADRVGHLPDQLSGGEQQRVAIARALVNNSPVVLADEPTGNLDSRSGKEIMKLLDEINRKGNSVIMITHDREIARYSSRLIALKDGKILEDRQGS